MGKQKTISYLLILTCFYGILVCLSRSGMSGEDNEDEAKKEGVVVPGYCGLYCLHAAAESLGKEIRFESLIDPRYIGSSEGSSISELTQAATDLGLHVKVLKNVTCNGLEHLSSPTILHVRENPTSPGYDHWVLVLGLGEGRVRIFDGAGKTEVMPLSRLAARWDGIALLISDRPIETTMIYFDSFLTTILIGAIFFVGMHLVSYTRKSTPNSFNDLLQGVGIYAVATVVFVGLYSLLNPIGYLNDYEAISGIQERQIADLSDEIDFTEMQQVLKGKDTLVIDARMKRDFDRDHIPGAISFPAGKNATLDQVMKEFDHLPRNTCVVFYCQSKGCSFDEYVARLFQAAGFKNIKFFTQGWMGWEAETSAKS